MNLDEPRVHRPVARQPRRSPSRTRPARVARAAPRTAAARARRTCAIRAGESVVLADIDGPGHDPPHLDDVPAGAARGHAVALLEVFYDGLDRAERVGAVPRLLRPAARPSRSRTTPRSTRGAGGARLQQLRADAVRRARAHRGDQRRGRGRSSSTTRSTTRSARSTTAPGTCTSAFRRENPTVQKRDFVIADGLEGPGRFLGCASACG